MTYLVTRRSTQRQFLLVPSKTVNQIFLFCLAHAAALYGIQVHAFCVLSNHFHLVVTDPGTALPRFMQWFDMYTAKCINALRGRWENLWSPDSYSAVRLGESEDVLDKILYTLTNPVAAGLVPRGAEWPGLYSRPSDIGKDGRTVRRPEIFFREDGSVPETATLKLTRPPAFKRMTNHEFRELLKKRVAAKEAEIRRQFGEEGRRFLGAARVLRQRPTDQPGSREPRRKLDPRVASKDKWHRIALLSLLKGFLKEYREAWRRYTSGERQLLFPAGTYWMRVHVGVRCRAPP